MEKTRPETHRYETETAKLVYCFFVRMLNCFSSLAIVKRNLNPIFRLSARLWLTLCISSAKIRLESVLRFQNNPEVVAF